MLPHMSGVSLILACIFGAGSQLFLYHLQEQMKLYFSEVMECKSHMKTALERL